MNVLPGIPLFPNSGTAGALHQDFHATDRQSPLDASRLLLVFGSFAGEAALTKEPRAESVRPTMSGTTLGGGRANALLPDDWVVDTGRAR